MWVDAGTTTLLPRGLFDTDGRCHRVVRLRPLTGWQEAVVTQANDPSGLLMSTIASIGDYGEPTVEMVEALSRGDRHHLLLTLRASLLGDRIPLVVECPNPACREQADVDVRVSELSPEHVEPCAELIRVEAAGHLAWLREPSGADDGYAAAASDQRSSVARLWSRVVVELDGQPLAEQGWWELPAPLRQHLALALAEGTRAPDLDFLAPCPCCRATLEFHLDPYAMLVEELQIGAHRLVAEVHTLALYYHWSEVDILALPRARRWAYLELVARYVAGRPGPDAWS